MPDPAWMSDGNRAALYCGDCREVMPTLPDEYADSIVCDPPYGLSFMGKGWDHGVPGAEFWQAAMRVAKPGAHLLAFGGTRTLHRLACAIEDAGWEIRDTVMWVYGSGFPKSLDVGKAIDKNNGETGRLLKFTAWMRTTGVTARQLNDATDTNMGGHYLTAASQPAIPTPELWRMIRPLCGDVPDWVDELVDRIEAEREVVGKSSNGIAGGTGCHAGQGDAYGFAGEFNITAPATDAAKQWHGWGTALKPAWEPVIVARKPLIGTVAENVLRYGTGAINVDGGRVKHGETLPKMSGKAILGGSSDGWDRPWKNDKDGLARRKIAADAAIEKANELGRWPANLIHDGSDEVVAGFPGEGDESAARFFKACPQDDDATRLCYFPKASKSDRGDGNNHPCVKGTALMRYLCRLVTQPGGVVLDPFMGSGSTGKAAMADGFRFIGIEREAEYLEIASRRVGAAAAEAANREGVFHACT